MLYSWAAADDVPYKKLIDVGEVYALCTECGHPLLIKSNGGKSRLKDI